MEMIKKSDLMAAVCEHCDLHGECEAGHCELTDVINELPTEDIVHCDECVNGLIGAYKKIWCEALGKYHNRDHYCAYGKRKGVER